MSIVNLIATGLGYAVMTTLVIVAVVGVVATIRDPMDKRQREKSDMEARMSVRFAELHKELDVIFADCNDLKVRVNAIENTVDQFRPSPEFKKPQQEGESA